MMGYLNNTSQQAKFTITILLSLNLFLSSLSSKFVPTDNYLIDCGSTTSTSIGDRVFMSDTEASDILSTPKNILANINTSTEASPLHHTARIFTETSTYSFSITRHGRVWIRLHFSPFVHETYDTDRARFSVSAQSLTLLRGFESRTEPVREFSVNVTSDALNVTFTPSPGSFAFLNAIEVVSVPDYLVTDDFLMKTDGVERFQGLSALPLETVWRVNMGGPYVSFENDTLSRTWIPDNNFLLRDGFISNISNISAVIYPRGKSKTTVTPIIAPPTVYGTATILRGKDVFYANITWEFEVDRGFRYLVRFHFCDILSRSLDTLYFNVYVESWSVANEVDLSALSYNSLRTAIYMDYVTPEMTIRNKLRISIGPSRIARDVPHAMLNGLEIMKINNSLGSFSSMDSEVVSSRSSFDKTRKILAICASIGAFLLVAVVLASFLIMSKKRKAKKLEREPKIAKDRGTRIPFLAIQEATNSFEDSGVIGTGGFGKVYKGVLKDGTKVAVKRKNPESQQGLGEFLTEIHMLSTFRHRHLVSIIGYCDEDNEMILVYEYVENGTLSSHLHGSERSALTWKQRLEICIGAARGLHYLHTGFERAIIHRDVKSANILLDENLGAKVADFGLSKIGPEISRADHVSTGVKGTFGYLDPEYFKKRRLTTSSDVYSFGVVLFEVLCGRAAVDSTLETEKIGLAGWAMRWHKAGDIREIVDPVLVGQIGGNCLEKFGDIAEKCLAESGVDRPSMGEVLRDLECVFQLQGDEF